MKQPANFRLSEETQALLAQLASEHCLSKTEVLEDAVKAYARQEGKRKKPKTRPHPLSKFAGTYSQADADAAMEVYHSRRGDNRPIPQW